jgi:pimeloyl-ACP methyl ester carboxylesterase
MPFKTISEHEIYYERSTIRSDKTLLFVHGTGGAVETWAPIRVYFSKLDCIFIDLPSHGRSSGKPLSVSDNATIVKEFITSFDDIRNIIYVGISYGSAIGIELACTYPKLLQGLVLMSPRTHFLFSDKELSSLVESVRTGEFVRRGAGKNTSESMVTSIQKGMLKTPLETIDALFRKFNGFDRRNEIEKIQIPTLLLSGRDDGISNQADAELLHDRVQNSTLITLETGHFIPIESPRETVKAMKPFIEHL